MGDADALVALHSDFDGLGPTVRLAPAVLWDQFFLSFVFIGSPYVGCQVGGVLVCLQACYYLVAFVLALFGKAVPSVGNHNNFVLPGAAAAGSLS
jgi:hypothetical protein